MMLGAQQLEENMQSTTAQTEFNMWRPAGLFMAVVVTADIAVHVAKHWRAYESFDKFFAIFVLLMLLTYPWFAFRKQMTAGTQLVMAYSLVLLVVWLFQ